MGKPSAGASDLASLVSTGSFTGTGTSAPVLVKGSFNFVVWGTFSGSVALERSPDGGTTWINCSTDAGGTPNAVAVPTSVRCFEPESGILYRVNCGTFASGTINWRISQ